MFFPALDRIPVDRYADAEAQILADVTAVARFLSAMGNRAGSRPSLPQDVPFRSSRLCGPGFCNPIAGLLNHMGFAAARHGVTLAIHTEAHTVACAPRDVDLFMLLTDPRYVSLCPDPAHIVLEGGNPVDLVARHRERVVAMHWKDATRAMPVDTPIAEDIHTRHRAYFCELGNGQVDFRQLAQQLAGAPRLCGPILELDACADPVPTLRRGMTFIETLAQKDAA
ncbi:TIM barrel protein [Komagataeibacter rhaeticus]|nr:TIM barrel protein [Komagataeibacter rhaeticus]